METFRKKLSDLIDESGLNQREFAEFLGVKKQSVESWLAGTTPKADMLKLISEKCGVSVDWLLGLQKDRTLDLTVKKICELTHLTSKSIEAIQTHERYWSFINHIFEYPESDNLLLALGKCSFAYQGNPEDHLFLLPDGHVISLKQPPDPILPAYEISTYDIVIKKQLDRIKEILDKIMPDYVKKIDNGVGYEALGEFLETADRLRSSEEGDLKQYFQSVKNAFGTKVALRLQRDILSDYINDQTVDEQTRHKTKVRIQFIEKMLQALEGEDNG